MKTKLIIFLIAIVPQLYSQNTIKQFDSLMYMRSYSGVKNIINQVPNSNFRTMYNKACYYSIVNKTDSAYYLILQVLKSKRVYYEIFADPDLENLRGNINYWKTIQQKLDSIIFIDKSLDKDLTIELIKRGAKDYIVRGSAMQAEDLFGLNSVQIATSNAAIRGSDSINHIYLKKIIDSLGKWPGMELIGKKANHYAILLYQHSPLEFRINYYKIIEEAYFNKQISSDEYAMITDRNLMAKGQKQLYGTQFMRIDGKFVLFENDDLKTINQNRKKIGLNELKQ